MPRQGHWHRMTGPKVDVRTPILCEKEPSISQYNTEDDRRVTCPRCWAILGKNQIAAHQTAGKTIRWEPVDPAEKQSWIKSRYTVWINEEKIAELEIQTGWGRRWHYRFIDDPLGRSYGEFIAKEQALGALPALVEQNKVLTPAMMAAQREERRKREEQAKEAQERWRAEREQQERDTAEIAKKNRALLQLAIDIVARHDNDTEGAREAKSLLECLRDNPKNAPL